MRILNTKLTTEIILHLSPNQQQEKLLKILKDRLTFFQFVPPPNFLQGVPVCSILWIVLHKEEAALFLRLFGSMFSSNTLYSVSDRVFHFLIPFILLSIQSPN